MDFELQKRVKYPMFKKSISSLLALILIFSTVGPLYSNALASSIESEVNSIDLTKLNQMEKEAELIEELDENTLEPIIKNEDVQVNALPVPLIVVAVQIVRHGVPWAVKKYGDDVAKAAQKLSAYSAAKNIKSSLLDDDGVIISLFTEKVKGKQALKDPKSKWVITRDVGKDNAHGGSYWKLMDKSGKRIATLDKDGKVLRK